MIVLIIHIGGLINTREKSFLLRGKELSELPMIENAFLLVEDDIISDYGHMHELEIKIPVLPKNIIDASGQFILPCWCDSHTHIVFGRSREEEFVDKIKGMSYADVAAKGGGILNSARVLNEMSEDELYAKAKVRLDENIRMGTGAIEIKSGYGLSVEGELKMLRVIKRLKQQSPAIIKATFLGAHTYPLAYRENHQGYINMIIQGMLPVIESEGLADYIDVFCEEGFFNKRNGTDMYCRQSCGVKTEAACQPVEFHRRN